MFLSQQYVGNYLVWSKTQLYEINLNVKHIFKQTFFKWQNNNYSLKPINEENGSFICKKYHMLIIL